MIAEIMAIPVTPEEVDMEAGAAHPGAGIHLLPAGDLLEFKEQATRGERFV